MVTSVMKLGDDYFLAGNLWQTLTVYLKTKTSFAYKRFYSQGFRLSSSHVQMWELDHKEGRALKNNAFEVRDWRRFESPLDSKEIKPVNPKGNHPWILTGRTDAEAEAPILWPPDVKSWLTRKDPDARENRRQNEKKVTGDEMIEWYHWFNGHELVQPLRDGEGQGGLACCSPWGLNWTQLGNWTTGMRYEVEHVLICHLYLYFGEMSVQTASCFKIGLFCNDPHGNRIFKKNEYNWLTLLCRRN